MLGREIHNRFTENPGYEEAKRPFPLENMLKRQRAGFDYKAALARSLSLLTTSSRPQQPSSEHKQTSELCRE